MLDVENVVVPPELNAEIGALVCRLDRLDDQGRCWVRLPDQPDRPVRARMTATAAGRLRSAASGAALLVITGRDGDPPIVLDEVVGSAQEVKAGGPAGSGAAESALPAVVDLRATEQLTLACGRATIVLKADGKLIIKGDAVLSYARGANRIKGASVQIN